MKMLVVVIQDSAGTVYTSYDETGTKFDTTSIKFDVG